MYPHYPDYYWRPRRMGPSRIVWFVVGAATASLWIKHKEADRGHPFFSHCRRTPIQPLPSDSAPQTPHSSWSPRAVSNTINSIPPAGESSWNFGKQSALGDEEKERLMAVTRQVTDAMTELSEATLDTVLGTVEALKAKLVEHRAEREKQKKLLDQQLEEQSKQLPPRLV